MDSVPSGPIKTLQQVMKRRLMGIRRLYRLATTKTWIDGGAEVELNEAWVLKQTICNGTQWSIKDAKLLIMHNFTP